MARLRKTCDECRRQKRRCDNPGSGRCCLRCKIKKIKCTTSTSQAGGRWKHGVRLDSYTQQTVEAKVSDPDNDADSDADGEHEIMEVDDEQWAWPRPQHGPQLQKELHDDPGQASSSAAQPHFAPHTFTFAVQPGSLHPFEPENLALSGQGLFPTSSFSERPDEHLYGNPQSGNGGP